MIPGLVPGCTLEISSGSVGSGMGLIQPHEKKSSKIQPRKLNLRLGESHCANQTVLGTVTGQQLPWLSEVVVSWIYFL